MVLELLNKIKNDSESGLFTGVGNLIPYCVTNKANSNPLLQMLKGNDKKGFFEGDTNGVGYPTGQDTLDYRLGYILDVYSEDGQSVVDSYPVLGLEDGSITTLIGETQTGKTTLACQMAFNIVKDFESGMVMHIDLEKSTTMARVVQINSHVNPRKLGEKYIINPNAVTFDDVFGIISEVADAKVKSKEKFKYDTGCKDMYGNNIVKYQPTVVLIDSLPQIQVSEEKSTELEGLTLGGRKAALASQFYSKIVPICKKANIVVMVINHVKDAMSMSAFDKKKATMFHQKSDKVIPCGKATLYLSHNILYLDTISRKNKYEMGENGFNGFDIYVSLWKSRTNYAGAFTNLVFNQSRGYDSIMALHYMAKENNLVGGRNPGSFYVGAEELGKFDTRKIYDELKRADVQAALKKMTKPFLEKMLSRVSSDDLDNKTESEFTGTPAEDSNELVEL